MRHLVALALCASACAADNAPGLILLDEGARDRGYEVVVEDVVGAPVLPIEASGDVALYTDDGRILELIVEPDQLVRIDVDGDEPLIERSEIGWDVDASSVMVEGEVESLRLLADSLPDHADELMDDTLVLSGDDVLYELAWAPELDGLWAVWTLELEDITDRVDTEVDGRFPTANGTAATSSAEPQVGVSGVGSFLAALFGATLDTSSRGRAQGSVLALPTDGLDRRPYVGFYSLEGKEVALSLDGQVRHGTHAGRPIATWALGSQGHPVVQFPSHNVPVQRVRVAEPAQEMP